MKLVSLALSAIMVVGMSVTTFAAEVQPAATTVGTLTIFSSNDGGSSSWDTSGHAFIAFKNSSSSSVTVGGLNVGAGHEITFGTWGNKSQHTGIWYNLESYFANNASAYGNRVSLSVWNSVSSKTLIAGTPNTPTSLMSSIKSKSGYQTGRSIGNTTPIGYVSNGSFVTVTMNKAASISKTNDIAVMDTTREFDT